MISDDERKEIARKFRELADYCDENEMSIIDDDWPGILSDYIWPEDSGYHIYDEDCRRLADLIEPKPERTCSLEYNTVHHDYVCTKCGERHDSGMYTSVSDDDKFLLKPMRFCPNCGVRFKDDEPQSDENNFEPDNTFRDFPDWFNENMGGWDKW